VNWKSKSGADWWKSVGFGFAKGAALGAVGGMAAKVLAPVAGAALRATFRPFLRALGRINANLLQLPGKQVAVQWLIRMSRFFLNVNVRYPNVTNTYVGRVLQRLFPSVDWETHHVLLQQAWSRVGGPSQIYWDDLLANEGLRRLANGLWNLLPIPASLNALLGQFESLAAVFATLYYAVVAYGIEQAREFMAEVFDDNTDVETDMEAMES
jgi:hypothetical protein